VPISVFINFIKTFNNFIIYVIGKSYILGVSSKQFAISLHEHLPGLVNFAALKPKTYIML